LATTSLALTGGVAPLVATWLVEHTGDPLSPAFVIMAAAAVNFAVLLWTKETYRRPMKLIRAAPST
jgi:MHS family proline/betaine transporter-like MFS transporter